MSKYNLVRSKSGQWQWGTEVCDHSYNLISLTPWFWNEEEHHSEQAKNNKWVEYERDGYLKTDTNAYGTIPTIFIATHKCVKCGDVKQYKENYNTSIPPWRNVKTGKEVKL